MVNTIHWSYVLWAVTEWLITFCTCTYKSCDDSTWFLGCQSKGRKADGPAVWRMLASRVWAIPKSSSTQTGWEKALQHTKQWQEHVLYFAMSEIITFQNVMPRYWVGCGAVLVWSQVVVSASYAGDYETAVNQGWASHIHGVQVHGVMHAFACLFTCLKGEQVKLRGAGRDWLNVPFSLRLCMSGTVFLVFSRSKTLYQAASFATTSFSTNNPEQWILCSQLPST